MSESEQARRDRDHGEGRAWHPCIAKEHADEFREDVLEYSHRAISRAGRRAVRAASKPVARKSAAKTSRARSPPGHSMSRPSPVQYTPKAESMTPTPHFTVFSGTRECGRWTKAPTRERHV